MTSGSNVSLKAVYDSLAPICGISDRLSCSMSTICVLRAAQSVKSARESYISAGTCPGVTCGSNISLKAVYDSLALMFSISQSP